MLFALPSVNVPAATSIVTSPAAVGVNVTVYTVDELALKSLSVPFETVISPTAKLDVASFEVKVNDKVASYENIITKLSTEQSNQFSDSEEKKHIANLLNKTHELKKINENIDELDDGVFDPGIDYIYWTTRTIHKRNIKTQEF